METDIPEFQARLAGLSNHCRHWYRGGKADDLTWTRFPTERDGAAVVSSMEKGTRVPARPSRSVLNLGD